MPIGSRQNARRCRGESRVESSRKTKLGFLAKFGLSTSGFCPPSRSRSFESASLDREILHWREAKCIKCQLPSKLARQTNQRSDGEVQWAMDTPSMNNVSVQVPPPRHRAPPPSSKEKTSTNASCSKAQPTTKAQTTTKAKTKLKTKTQKKRFKIYPGITRARFPAVGAIHHAGESFGGSTCVGVFVSEEALIDEICAYRSDLRAEKEKYAVEMLREARRNEHDGCVEEESPADGEDEVEIIALLDDCDDDVIANDSSTSDKVQHAGFRDASTKEMVWVIETGRGPGGYSKSAARFLSGNSELKYGSAITKRISGVIKDPSLPRRWRVKNIEVVPLSKEQYDANHHVSKIIPGFEEKYFQSDEEWRDTIQLLDMGVTPRWPCKCCPTCISIKNRSLVPINKRDKVGLAKDDIASASYHGVGGYIDLPCCRCLEDADVPALSENDQERLDQYHKEEAERIAVIRERKAKERYDSIRENGGGLELSNGGFNLYEFARRALGFTGSLKDFFRHAKYGPFARKSKLLQHIQDLHESNIARGFGGTFITRTMGTCASEAAAGVDEISDDVLKKMAKAYIESLIRKGYNVLYLSIGGEHKMRIDSRESTGAATEIARNARKRLKNQNSSHDGLVREDEIHKNVFPEGRRERVMRSANTGNAERYEVILIDTAFRYHKDGIIKLLNRLGRGNKAHPASLSRGYCMCSIYSEVWCSFEKEKDLNGKGYYVV